LVWDEGGDASRATGSVSQPRIRASVECTTLAPPGLPRRRAQPAPASASYGFMPCLFRYTSLGEDRSNHLLHPSQIPHRQLHTHRSRKWMVHGALWTTLLYTLRRPPEALGANPIAAKSPESPLTPIHRIHTFIMLLLAESRLRPVAESAPLVPQRNRNVTPPKQNGITPILSEQHVQQ
jgi:hypothetical protein